MEKPRMFAVERDGVDTELVNKKLEDLRKPIEVFIKSMFEELSDLKEKPIEFSAIMFNMQHTLISLFSQENAQDVATAIAFYESQGKANPIKDNAELSKFIKEIEKPNYVG